MLNYIGIVCRIAGEAAMSDIRRDVHGQLWINNIPLCDAIAGEWEEQLSAHHICVMVPNHADTHMCECGWEWHNQVGGSRA